MKKRGVKDAAPPPRRALAQRAAMTFAQALAALDSRQETRIRLGLARVRRHLSRLGDPQKGLRCFHVAGTNGKGSVCAMLEAALRGLGHRTGLYLSPHLADVRERIRVDGAWIPRPAFARLMARALGADPRRELTYFELLTSIAFQWFRERRVDFCVLETGLGGRLDATNVVERPLACVITSIHYDHTRFLGKSLAAIAGEKAGIAKRGCVLLCPPLPAVALRSIRRQAKAAGARFSMLSCPHRLVRADWSRGRQVLESPALGRYSLALLGERQGLNAALAEAALERSGIAVPARVWKRGMARLGLPGRFQVRRLGGKTAILDGAHNVEAAGNLASIWKASPWSRGRSRWIVGVMKDKDAAGIARALAPYLREVVAVRPPSPRALEPLSLAEEIRRQAPKARVTVERDPETALKEWRRKRGAPPTAVVCGSFYLVGRAAQLLRAPKTSSHGLDG